MLPSLALLLWLGAPPAGPGPSKEVVSQEGGFAIVMPCVPKAETTPVDTAQGRMVMHGLSCQAPGFMAMAVAVQATDLSGDPVERLDNTRDGAVARVREGKVTAEEVITVEGRPGRAVRLEGANGQLAVARFILDQKQNRLYQVFAGTTRTGAPEKEIEKFLASFRLLEK